MIKIVRSTLPLLTSGFKYTDSKVKRVLRTDFKGLCYLCEEYTTKHAEVDHFYPVKFYPNYEHDWKNLFYICQKCNKIRPKKINTCSDDEIINCCELNPTGLISFIYDFKSDKINIQNLLKKDSKLYPKTKNTCQLLERIYNGVESQSLSYIDLRTEIKRQLQHLDKLLDNFEAVKPAKLKRAFRKKIVKHFNLSKQNNKSSFISFKIAHLKTTKYYEHFEYLFEEIIKR